MRLRTPAIRDPREKDGQRVSAAAPATPPVDRNRRTATRASGADSRLPRWAGPAARQDAAQFVLTRVERAECRRPGPGGG